MKPNYAGNKRRRELDAKRKKEEKAQKMKERKALREQYPDGIPPELLGDEVEEDEEEAEDSQD